MRNIWAVSSLAVAGLALAACSSNANTTSTTGGVAAATSACVDRVSASVKQAGAPIAPKYPGQPLDASKNRGKLVWFLSAAESVPTQVAIWQGVNAAASAAGMNSRIFDGASSPSNFNVGIEQAIAQKAGGIIMQGVDPNLVKGPLADAQAAGIPVIDSLSGGPAAPLPLGMAAHVTIDYSASGATMADWTLEQTGCKADALELSSTLYVALRDRQNGFLQEYTKQCPSCKVKTTQIDYTSLASSVDAAVRTALQRDPNINYIASSDDAAALGVISTLKALGKDVPVIGANGQATALALISKGDQAATVSMSPLAYMGWVQVDLLQRAMLKMQVPSGTLPQQLLTKATVTQDPSAQWPGYADYQTKYKQLWNAP